ncbi:MAG: SGNH/GDSL hydrolase family protein [Bdellovibrionota bacterium]|nr:SGNH/GDSL hydrolase family protein [Bdellovibrionota bacterium]
MKTLFFLFFFSFNTFSQRAPYPKNMAALGDSYSRAANAGVSRKHSGRIWNFSKFVFSGLKMQMGLNKDFPVTNFDYPVYNWSTGTDPNIQSHWRRISELSDKKIKQYNVAISGATSENLKDELKKLNEWSVKNLKQPYPDYVTLLIGGNDACIYPGGKTEPTTSKRFGENIENIVKEILTKSPRSKMLLVSMPNFITMTSMLRNQRLFSGKKTCEWIWKQAGICVNFTLEKDKEKVAASQQMIVQYNLELEKVVNKYKKRMGDRVRVSSRVEHHVWEKDDFSIDCFHMSQDGMKEFSDLVWRDSWWGTERSAGHAKWHARRIECGVEYKNKIVDRNFFYVRKGLYKNLTSEVIYVTPKDPVYLSYHQHPMGKSEVSIQNYNEKNKHKLDSVWKVGRMINIDKLAKTPLKLWFRTLSQKRANVVCKVVK